MAAANSSFSAASSPEVFFSDSASSDAIAYAVRTGRARKLGPRLYTKTMAGDEAGIARRNWASIAAGYFPGAVITGRTALDPRPDKDDGSVFLVAPSIVRARNVELPGLRLRAEPGTGPVEGDMPFMGRDVFLASRPRAFMSNFRASRARAGVRRTLTRPELEDALEGYGRLDETALNRLRDEARALAEPLGYEAEFVQLDGVIGTLLGTRDVKLSSSRAQASARGQASDPVRIDRFTALATALLTKGLPAAAQRTSDDVSVLSFYESYFSNYIEGTEFTVSEARAIIFEGVVPVQRPKDAHDILGTYQLVVDPFQRARTPATPDELLAILQNQHAAMMSGRPEIGLGAFKTANNQVGGRVFVDWRLVEGTLRQAFELYASLPSGFARAAFAMFLVAEVHPFADGNGRTARLLMNSELSAAGQQRIIVTTRRRGDYLTAMRGMTNQLNIDAYVAVLAALQRDTANIDFSGLDMAQAQLEAQTAFTDPDLDTTTFDGLLSVADPRGR
jgi:hypothetical protein